MPLTAPIANALSSFCLEAGTVLDEMALCREGSPDPKLLDLGRGPILGPDAISPHGAGVRSGGKAAKVSPLRSASGVGATEGILVPPSSNRDGRPRAQRGTEGRFSVLRALRWVYFLYCYVQLLFSFSSRICLGAHVSPPDAVSLTLGRYRGHVPAPLGPASTRSGLRSALRRPALVGYASGLPGGDEEADPDGGPPKRRGSANTSWRTSGGKHSGSVGP